MKDAEPVYRNLTSRLAINQSIHHNIIIQNELSSPLSYIHIVKMVRSINIFSAVAVTMNIGAFAEYRIYYGLDSACM